MKRLMHSGLYGTDGCLDCVRILTLYTYLALYIDRISLPNLLLPPNAWSCVRNTPRVDLVATRR